MSSGHKTCPFCGGTAEIIEEKLIDQKSHHTAIDTYYKYISCTKCKARSGRLKTKIVFDSWDDVSTTRTGVYDEHVWKLWDSRV